MKQTVSEFITEFNLRKQYTPSLRYLNVRNVKELRIIKQIMSN